MEYRISTEGAVARPAPWRYQGFYAVGFCQDGVVQIRGSGPILYGREQGEGASKKDHCLGMARAVVFELADSGASVRGGCRHSLPIASSSNKERRISHS